ncbi:MAG TPA: (Fe-S)-binding protein [Candidatus Nanopelagicales bacterium]|nr:(Fe-S)-binding protein [Candidatus Nanopelagicales bacterium]
MPVDVTTLTPFSETHLTVRLVVGVVILIGALGLAAWRGLRILTVIRSGQPAVGRTDEVGMRLQAEATEVLGQRKLLTWQPSGLAHFFTFWGFIILGLTIIEAFGALFDPDFHVPIIGTWAVVGFLEDFFGLAVLVALVVFSVIRIRTNPHKIGRDSRFYGSHTGGAWLILASIATIVITLFIYRGAQINNGTFPFPRNAAFVSNQVAKLLEPLGTTANEWIETTFIILSFGAVLGTTILVLYSKHMHIFLAPFNVLFSRRPNGLGPLLPMYSGKDRIDFEDPDDDAVFGRGSIRDFTWKGNLDLLTCTECGRCQSQCPAWNTEKPLSPKLLIMALRDNLLEQAPYIAAQSNPGYLASPGTGKASVPIPVEIGSFSQKVQDAHARPLVGVTETDGAVIDEDVLWSCTTCGACVNQCPVDIEHIDHIVDMRRNRVMIESEFPGELAGLFKNVENKGNPWGLNASQRNQWIEEVDFDVRVFGMDGEDAIPDDVDYLFWVGCAGALEDRAKKTTKAVAELLHLAGVQFMVLGEGETCTGDPARRAGNEFLFQMQAMQNVEMLNEIKAKKIVVTCPHCLNTLGREYPQVGGHYEVVHHSQLLASLVKDGRITPVSPVEGSSTVTYHDPCYLGRHNKVYTPPRELLGALPGLEVREMEKSAERSFCCGAGGARMWMEERIGTRINLTRTDMALETGASTIAVACPFCSVMLNDGVTQRSQGGDAPVAEVADIATLLLASVEKTPAS